MRLEIIKKITIKLVKILKYKNLIIEEDIKRYLKKLIKKLREIIEKIVSLIKSLNKIKLF